MVEIFRVKDDAVAKIKTALFQIGVFDLGGKFGATYRKIPVCHLAAHYIFQGVLLVGYRAVNLQLCSRKIDWGEKGEPHDMVPMGMGEEELRLNGPFGKVVGHHIIAQLTDA